MCKPESQSATVTTEPTQDGIDHDYRSHAQRQHDVIGALLRGQLGDPKLGQHKSLPVTVIVLMFIRCKDETADPLSLDPPMGWGLGGLTVRIWVLG